MRRLFTLTLTLAVLIAGFAFVAAPWFAFRALREATEAGDVAAAQEIVDYSAVRSALRDQIVGAAEGRPVEEVPAPVDPLRDPFGAMRRYFEQNRPLAPRERLPDVDRYVTLAGLRSLTYGYGGDAVPSGVRAPMPSVDYWGANRARISVAPRTRGETLFTFQRRGIYQWKLVHVRLPDPNALPAGAETLDQPGRLSDAPMTIPEPPAVDAPN